MFSVSSRSNTPENSLYRFGAARKEISYSRLFTKLIEAGQDPNNIRDIIHAEWNKTAQTASDEVQVTELNNETRKLFRFFRWHSDLKGAVSLFCKTNRKKEVYTHSSELLESAQCVKPPGMNQTIYAWMYRKYHQLIRNKQLTFYHQIAAKSKNFPTLAHYWKTWAEPIWKQDPVFQLEEPPLGISDNPQKPCFFYFNPQDLKPGPTPNWDGWIQIIPKPLQSVFRAWVYSIFVPNNTGRQALWLHDNGYTGKTSVINAISQYLGKDASGAISSGSMKTNFAFETIYGKRFVSYGDCNEPNLIKHPKIHSILGNDIVIIDQKNMKPFPAKLHCRLIVASNLAPYININAHNERTRVLYIPLTQPTEDQLRKFCKLDQKGQVVRYDNGSPVVVGGNLQQELYSEMEAFLASCETDYRQLCTTGQDVLVSQHHLDLMEHHCISEEELTFRNICNQMFIFKEIESIPLRIVQQTFNVATSGTPYRSSGISDFSRFKKYLMDRKSVTIEKTKGNSRIRTQMCYGIRLNPDGALIAKLESYLTDQEIDTYISGEAVC